MSSQPTTGLLTSFFLASGTEDNADIGQFLHRVLDLGIAFKTSENVSARAMKSERETVSFDSMPDSGLSYEELAQAFAAIVSGSNNSGSPNFLGCPDAGNNVAGLAASVLTPLLNQNMANQNIASPEATFVEMEVVHWLRTALGYSTPPAYSKASEIGGILTLGGCLSNTIALSAAREKLFPGSGLKGLPVLPSTIRILAPDVVGHYSVRSAMAWLSLGTENVVYVPVDDKFRMDQQALERIINHEQAQGNRILACVAYAGDSRTMTIDHLDSVADLLHKHDIWFHVDACHGGQLIFSETHRRKLVGIEKADSITVDPHKILCIPYTCSFVLFKDPSTHAATATNSGLILNTQWSLGRITPFIGSKAFDALKLWATIKFFGASGLGRMIDERLALTHAIEAEIAMRPDLVLLNTPDINTSILIFLPKSVQDYCIQHAIRLSDSDREKVNQINIDIKEGVLQGGVSFVHGFSLKSCPHESFIDPHKPLFVLRIVNGNPSSTITHAIGLLDQIQRLGRELFAQPAYQLMASKVSPSRLQKVEQKLHDGLRHVFGPDPYAAVVYGSSAQGNDALPADVDLMVFAPTADVARAQAIETIFRSVMEQEDVLIDTEVPFHRKLLVPISLAERAAEAGPPRDEDGRVSSIEKTSEYLASDAMLERLVFNVLTTANKVISTSDDKALTSTLDELQQKAGHTLVKLIHSINPGIVKSAEDFVRLAGSDGVRSGKEYLGYDITLSPIAAKLEDIFRREASNKNKD